MFRLLALAALLGAAIAASAAVEPLKIFQHGKAFSERAVTIKAGDAVEFVNDDENVHNIHSVTPGFEFDLGAQEPNTTASHVFAAPGEAEIRCAIHPRMRLTVKVE